MPTWALALFFASCLFIGYTLYGYRWLMQCIAHFRSRPVQQAQIEPFVTIIIPVHNAGPAVRRKIENALKYEYPKDKVQIIIASDYSTDDTNEVVREYSDRGVVLVSSDNRLGKHHLQRLALERATGEFVIFTDVGILIDPQHGVRSIVRNFSDPTVGCVSSEDQVMGEGKESGEGNYVTAEMQLRQAESRANSLVGASGSLFAARRELCTPWHDHQSSDFFLPLHAFQKGYRTVSDPDVVGVYAATKSSSSEFRRKVRTIVHGLDVLFDHISVLNPARYGLFSLQLVSHKLFRWLLPFGFLAVFGLSGYLAFFHPNFLLFWSFQVVGYLVGIFGLLFPRLQRWSLVRIASFFIISIGATFWAWVEFVQGEKYVIWEPTKRP